MPTVDPATRAITVPSIVAYFDEKGVDLNTEYHNRQDYLNAINNYGIIYKTVSFSEETDVNKIREFCYEWIRKNYYDGVLSFDIKAVDLHLLGYERDKIRCGDRMRVEFMDTYKTPVTRTLTCISAQLDLMKPGNSTYKIGIPDVSADVKYRSSVKKKITSQGKKNEEPNIEKTKDELLDWVLDVTGIDMDTDPQNGGSGGG